MRRSVHTTRTAFTLVELVAVVVIIGMIASMAIPRINRGSHAAAAAALRQDLAIVRGALEHYHVEHRNRFPGATSTDVLKQLTLYSSIDGDTSSAYGDSYIFGPYLFQIPAVPLGRNEGNDEIAIDAVNSPPEATAGAEGWVYNPNTGEFLPNDSRFTTIVAGALDAIAEKALEATLEAAAKGVGG